MLLFLDGYKEKFKKLDKATKNLIKNADNFAKEADTENIVIRVISIVISFFILSPNSLYHKRVDLFLLFEL